MGRRFGRGWRYPGGALARRLGLEFAEGFEGAQVGAPGGIDAALEAEKEIVAPFVGIDEAIPVADAVLLVFGDGLAFDGAEAAETPLIETRASTRQRCSGVSGAKRS